MKLWLISQTERDGYETYDSAVVAAETADDARTIHPDGSSQMPNPDSWNWSWVKDPAKVTAVLIGEATPETKRGVILASFNAG